MWLIFVILHFAALVGSTLIVGSGAAAAAAAARENDCVKKEDMPFGFHKRPGNGESAQRRRKAQQVVSCGSCCYILQPPPTSFPRFYKKGIQIRGFWIVSSGQVSDQAVYEAALLVDKFTLNRPDLLAILVNEGVRFVILGANEVVSKNPDYASLVSQFPGTNWDLYRGLGATLWYPFTSAAEENLLCFFADIYRGENIGVHEFSHTVAGSGGSLPTKRTVERGGSQDLNDAIRESYGNAMSKGLWQSTYAGTNFEEYWAEGVQSFFNVNAEGRTGTPVGDGVHNSINTRKELRAYDPQLETLLTRVFPSSDGISFPCPSSSCDCSSYTCPGRPPVTSAPTKAPKSSDLGNFCFSGKVTVDVKNKGIIPMNQLQIGDQVLSADHKYDTVYSFGHYARTASAQYILFLPSMLEVSSDHLVFLKEGKAVPASTVRVGDVLLHGDSVTEIKTVTSQGVYAPFTLSGTILVNRVGTSCYVSLEKSSDVLTVGSMPTGLSYQFLAHTLLLPRRLWCRDKGCDDDGVYTEDGVAVWVDLPMKIAKWFLQQPTAVMSAVMIPLGCVVILFYAPGLVMSVLLVLLLQYTVMLRWKTSTVTYQRVQTL